MNKKYECFYCGTVEKIKFAEDTYPYDIGHDEERGCGASAPVKKGKAETMQRIMERIHEEIEAGLRDVDGVPY